MLRGLDTKSLLDSLLQGGQELARQGGQYARQGRDYAAEKLDIPQDEKSMEGFTKGILGGAAGAGVLSLILGTETGRKIGGTGVALGGLAALGKLAYDKWQDYQASTAQAPKLEAPPVDKLDGEAADQRARALLGAMIAAAKADGHMDDNERAAIQQRLTPLGAAATDFLFDQMAKPADPHVVAAGADDPQAKAEIYAVSVLVCGDPVPAERDYLDRLAAALSLPPKVAAGIEAELRSGHA